MAITIGEGGGSTLSTCSVSPFDIQGTIDNLVKRVETLENIISQLLGANLNANQLSDISEQVGWVYGITYMGTPGWIQTASGSLIPPTGWTLSGSGILVDSDGNDYQGVLMDSDGVLQYGFTASGAIVGNSAGSNSYISLNSLSGTPGDALNLGTVSSQRGAALTLTNTTTITINQKGVYAYNLIVSGTSADLDDNETFHAQQQFGYPFTFTTSGDWAGVVDEDSKFFATGTQIGIVTTVPCTLRILWNSSGDPSAGIVQSAFTVVKMQNIV